MNYKISVVMPVYNEENYLSASIESILNQTFTDFEFIIIDDGSTDDSAKIIKSLKILVLFFTSLTTREWFISLTLVLAKQVHQLLREWMLMILLK